MSALIHDLGILRSGPLPFSLKHERSFLLDREWKSRFMVWKSLDKGLLSVQGFKGHASYYSITTFPLFKTATTTNPLSKFASSESSSTID